MVGATRVRGLPVLSLVPAFAAYSLLDYQPLSEECHLKKGMSMEGPVERVKRKFRELFALSRRLDVNSMLLGKLHVDRIQKVERVNSLREVEFRVYSQGGEDGIIQWLIARVPIEERSFIEFGVESYMEANTRFLLINDDWKGLVIDGNKTNVDRIVSDGVAHGSHNLTAICAFVTRENVNDLFQKNGFSGDIGLLSIDVDGNDYWLWDAIDVVKPRIVICEYNGTFGPDASVTVPYDPGFQRTSAHYSNLYFGASLSALCILAERKGYNFVGSNSMGTNAFFVRDDVSAHVPKLTAKEGFVQSSQRTDSRDARGVPTHIGGPARLALIEDMRVLDVTSNNVVRLGDVVR